MTAVPIEHLSSEELCQRMYDLALNLYYDDQTLTLPHDIANLFGEAADECRRRGLNDVFVVPAFTQIGDPPPIVHQTSLVRYGTRSHLEDLVRGIISFGPSSLYRDAPLDAQRDDEARRRFRAPNQTLTIGDVHYSASKIVLHSHIAELDGTPINYHLFCTAREESLKLCRAFHADGFVRIRNYREFFSLVDAELRARWPKAEIFGSSVRYYDDREQPPPRQLNKIILHKTINYIYQREVRFAVLHGPTPDERFHIQIQPPDGLFELQLT